MIYAFDFDLTLTNINSHGVPMEINKELFGNIYNINRIKALFFKLQTNKHKIVIVTRALETQVREYLLKYNIIVDAIIGSPSKKESISPILTKNEKKLLYLDNIFEGSATEIWALRKVAILLKLCKDEMENHNKVLFFDDTKKNIEVANRYFRYCFFIKNRLDETVKTANILSKFLLCDDLAKLRYEKIKIKGQYKTILFDRLKNKDQIIKCDRGLFFLRDLIQFDNDDIIKKIINGTIFKFIMKYNKFISNTEVENRLIKFIKGGFRYKMEKYKSKYKKIIQ